VLPVVAVAAAGTEIGLAAAAHTFTTLSEVVVGVGLAALVAVAGVQLVVRPVPNSLARRAPRNASGQNGAWWPWVALLVVVAVWEVFCWSTNPRPAHPTLSSLLDLLTAHAAARAVAFAGWIALGGYLVTR
jgi:hypothetical protein